MLDYWWTVDITGLSYGEESFKSSNIDKAIFDTGTSLITMPTEDFYVFAEKMKAIGISNCSASACYTEDKCEALWPDMESLSITLGGSVFKLEPWQYSWNVQNRLCRVGVSSLDASPYIMGDTFLRSYITSFDLANSKVTIGKSVNAPVQTELSHHFWLLLFFCLAATAVLIVLVVGCCKDKIKSCCKRGNAPASQHYTQVSGNN